jgi:hypothetical protein
VENVVEIASGTAREYALGENRASVCDAPRCSEGDLRRRGAGRVPAPGVVSGGTFEGERLSGEVLNGGNDWQDVRADGATTLDVRLVPKTNDGALIAMSYRGVRHGPADVLARIDRGEAADPQSYYFRIGPMFETASERYAWLNRVLAIGVGHRLQDGVVYSVFEVL